jgi:4-oxalocrotonate tautomerase
VVESPFCRLYSFIVWEPGVPYVNVKITKEGLTREKKATLVRGITDLLVEVLGKKPEHTHIVIDEVDDENWGYAGVLTDEYRRQSKA